MNDSITRLQPGDLGQGACDGTVSYPGGAASPSGAPVIMWGPDCADGAGFPNQLGDYPRAAVARPADPSDPLLLVWKKGPHNISFTNGSQQTEPCSFPGKVWKSEVGEYWNMLCSPHWAGNWGGPWARSVLCLLCPPPNHANHLVCPKLPDAAAGYLQHARRRADHAYQQHICSGAVRLIYFPCFDTCNMLMTSSSSITV